MQDDVKTEAVANTTMPLDKAPDGPEPEEMAASTDPNGIKTRILKKDKDLTVGDMLVVWSNAMNRQKLREMRAKIRKANKKWDGVVLHLQPGETIGSMKLPQVQALYEAIMSRFDPDLYEIRMSRKEAAQAQAKASEEAAHEMTANQVADRLAAIRKVEEKKQTASVIEASVRIEAAARS